MRKKVILAAIFAAEVLSGQGIAMAEEAKVPDDSAITKLVNDPEISSETKAYILIRSAEKYMGDDPYAGTHLFIGNASTSGYALIRRREELITIWVENILLAKRLQSDKGFKPATLPTDSKERAGKALSAAVKILSDEPNDFRKLNLLLVASMFFQTIGDDKSSTACSETINSAIRSCELDKEVNSVRVKAAVSILDAMAYRYAPHRNRTTLRIVKEKDSPPLEKYTDEDFREAEKIRLRAVAIADRLAPTDHERRLAHRDMALWYELFDKKELASEQKEILYKLVGIRDERILQPLSMGCGQLTWWTAAPEVDRFCGMG